MAINFSTDDYQRQMMYEEMRRMKEQMKREIYERQGYTQYQREEAKPIPPKKPAHLNRTLLLTKGA